MSLRQPVRATLSPISVHARVTVSSENVSVPGYSICSLDLPIACDGQDQYRHIVGYALDRSCEIALVDEHVDADRQVGAMLLDRGHRQNRDDFAHVGGGKITPAHLGPKLGWQHADLLALKARARRRPRSRS